MRVPAGAGCTRCLARHRVRFAAAGRQHDPRQLRPAGPGRARSAPATPRWPAASGRQHARNRPAPAAAGHGLHRRRCPDRIARPTPPCTSGAPTKSLRVVPADQRLGRAGMPASTSAATCGASSLACGTGFGRKRAGANGPLHVAGLAPDVALELAGVEGVKQAVRAGAGIGFVSIMSMRHEDGALRGAACRRPGRSRAP